MSRVGKNPVVVPDGVTVAITNQVFSAKGKLGELTLPLTDEVDTVIEGNSVTVTPKSDSKFSRSMWGTTRAQIKNLVQGVSSGYVKRMEMVGVGYRAAVQGNALKLALGFSHDVEYPIPEGIAIKCETPTVIEISGASKQKVGQVAAEIRAYRPPEPYKGKGVKYTGEYIVRKEGKKK
ncbi:MAG: 50S ribosomal protein L6 [Alphaproteobacteria bacterium RIFOXYD12_FULL_60_8]|nr:MAG: 50S ribosomal protein L6 [Alphaproteobacteria bacterium RIFOXYD12_FULL_60_8]